MFPPPLIYFCIGLFENIGLNLPYLFIESVFSTRIFHVCIRIMRTVFGATEYSHLHVTFWKPKFQQWLVCMFFKVENILCYIFFSYIHICLNVRWCEFNICPLYIGPISEKLFYMNWYVSLIQWLTAFPHYTYIYIDLYRNILLFSILVRSIQF